MTASFLEQMLTIYTHLGMLSRGKVFPLLYFLCHPDESQVQLV
jgi:hypothetical protein